MRGCGGRTGTRWATRAHLTNQGCHEIKHKARKKQGAGTPARATAARGNGW